MVALDEHAIEHTGLFRRHVEHKNFKNREGLCTATFDMHKHIEISLVNIIYNTFKFSHLTFAYG